MRFDRSSARLKFFPLIVVGGLALASLAVITSAWGHSSGGGRHERYDTTPKCEGPSQHGRLHHKRGHYGTERLAMKLSAMETAIGIRANQLDAWRDFTDALLAVTKRPPRASSLDHHRPHVAFKNINRL
jgi:hypothetical protein